MEITTAIVVNISHELVDNGLKNKFHDMISSSMLLMKISTVAVEIDGRISENLALGIVWVQLKIKVYYNIELSRIKLTDIGAYSWGKL